MALFTKEELGAIDAIASGDTLTDPDRKRVDALKVKLGASTQAEVVERFVALTGWTNRPKDYPA